MRPSSSSFIASAFVLGNIFTNNVIQATPITRSALSLDEPKFTLLAAAAQNAYCNSPINTVVEDMTLLYKYANGENAHSANIYHSTSHGLILSFAQSNSTILESNIHEWNVSPVPAPPMLRLPPHAKVVSIAGDAFNEVWVEFNNNLKQIIEQYPNDSISVGAHGAGGAFGTLIAMAIAKNYPGKLGYIAMFGAPRVGNEIFIHSFNTLVQEKYALVINGNDFVPNYPSTTLGYIHPAGLIHISPANSNSYSYFSSGDDLNLLTSRATNSNASRDNLGTYMKTLVGGASINCPTQVKH